MVVTCKSLDTIVEVLEVEGLTNLTFAVLGIVSSSEYEVIMTSTTGISTGIVPIRIRLVGRT